MDNQDYKNAAINALSGHWAQAVLATIVFFLVNMVVLGPSGVSEYYHNLTFPAGPIDWKSSTWEMIAAFFLIYPLSVGFVNAFKELVNKGDANLTRNMFTLGFTQWLHKVWTMFLMYIFILLWTLLLIIPGIIKTFSYAMTPFIVVDHPELSANECVDLSKKMMKGRKFDLFYLYLSFIGWFLLCIPTCFIGLLWLQPYVNSSVVAFYNDVKAPFEPAVEEPAPAPAPVAPEAYQPIAEQPVETAQPVEPEQPSENQ
jgi:uncharacterized membrane protein